MLDVPKFIAGLHDYIGRALQPFADRIKALEERKPEKGERGEKGEPGRDGKDGLNGADGRDGADGNAGADGKDGRDGIDGKDGKDGVDGKSITIEDVRPMLEAEQAKWALEFERRANDVLQRAIDRIPAPKDGRDGLNGADGKDGVDGLGFDDLTVEQVGERGAVIRFVRGDQVKEFSLHLPAIIDCGVYREGEEYSKGDAVTWGGSLWIAQKDKTVGKPGTDGWRLAVKKGRDGKDGKDGERGQEGKQGPAGRDLTQLGTDGAKW